MMRSANSASKPSSWTAWCRRSPGRCFTARLAGNLLSPLPYSVATHSSPALADAVRRFAAKHRIDVWHCEWTPYAQVLRDAFGSRLASARWSVMAHNVESLIWRRYVETEANPMKRWYVRRQLHKFEKFEQWAYSSAASAIAVSDDDADLMRERFGVNDVSVVENGVDTEYFHPQRDVDRDPRPHPLPRQPRLAAQPGRRQPAPQ